MATSDERREFIENLQVEADTAEWLLSTKYSRSPELRKEARLELPIADRLQQRRGRMVFEEFSPTWNRKAGELP